jgi:diguanylate cyclase (GGDEF)-like protein
VIDVLTCYAVTGVSALLGLSLMWLVQTDQPRVLHALHVFKWAFAALSGMALVLAVPFTGQAELIKVAIGFAGMGVTLLAWAFRQLNGRRTPPWVGGVATLLAGLSLFGAATTGSDAQYELAIGATFSAISLLMAIDQGWLVLQSRRWHVSELTLLVVSVVFAVHWLIMFHHTLTVPGPFPADWLHEPAWLRPISGIGFALLPLAVATLVLATINGRLMQQLRARSLSDDLTGALSRRGLRELGERMLALQRSQTSEVAVLMLDLDHFKAVNDRYGHQIGDEVLRHVTHVVRDHLREDALLARYGGEEFTVLLPVKNPQEAHGVAERLRRAVESTPCETRIGPVRATISIGVSFHCPTSTLEEDLSKADTRLYAAKQSGRNRVEYAEPDC